VLKIDFLSMFQVFQAVYFGMERMIYPKSLAKQMNVFENGFRRVEVCRESDGTPATSRMVC